METAFARTRIAIADDGLEGVARALEPEVRKFRGACLLAQRKGSAKNGKTVFGQIRFDRRAERWGIVRKNAASRMRDQAVPRYSRRFQTPSWVAPVRKPRNSSGVSKLLRLLVHLRYELLVILDPQVHDIMGPIGTGFVEVCFQRCRWRVAGHSE